MLLNDGEIRDAGAYHSIMFLQKKATAKAQLKKVVELLDDYERVSNYEGGHSFMIPNEVWQSLLEETK